MNTIITHRGKRIEVISSLELREPVMQGNYVRAYCHIHGSDHQRSLSINRATGWGHCFNAACGAVVLVAEWNSAVAGRLLHDNEISGTVDRSSDMFVPNRRLPLALQPVLLHIPNETQVWQRNELSALQSLQQRARRSLLSSQRARAYLEERSIPLRVALKAGAGYLPPEVISDVDRQEQRALLRRWAARIVFPLVSPFSEGYIGRALWRWRPGVDESSHKALLEQSGDVKRWVKTNPAGWSGCVFEQLARTIIVVEGAFDRLALLAAGFDAREVVALTGTAMQIDWLPPQVRNIVLALDGDQGGMEATGRLADRLEQEGYAVKVCSPPQDRWGKDWNERWRNRGREGLWPLRAVGTTRRSA